MNDDPKYRYVPGVGLARTNNASKHAFDAWCPAHRSPQHVYTASALDPRFEVCRLCVYGHRRVALDPTPAPASGGAEGVTRS